MGQKLIVSYASSMSSENLDARRKQIAESAGLEVDDVLVLPGVTGLAVLEVAAAPKKEEAADQTPAHGHSHAHGHGHKAHSHGHAKSE